MPQYRFHGDPVRYWTKPSQGSKSTEYANAQGKRKKVIYDGRWAKSDVSTVAPPIQFFYPIFETFIHDVSGPHMKPTRDDIIDTQKFMHVASRIPDEGSRRSFNNKTVTYRTLDLELKRELGEGGSDASTQGELAMRRVWTDKVSANLVKKCCCPTLILAGGGPWLTVLGGVFTDKF
ncbi:hypothetical protein BDQ12DRAFT_728279 [Crucibulum laeve]|uniref:Uncharacterized protein n=1 Tax=Crucibulum laeve TaxID=68775 RepID=A0A5C3LIE8_9AGAR|nr:hypothetical protein BDQ12DRAFT_728279 [Crucibulum laeve]